MVVGVAWPREREAAPGARGCRATRERSACGEKRVNLNKKALSSLVVYLSNYAQLYQLRKA